MIAWHRAGNLPQMININGFKFNSVNIMSKVTRVATQRCGSREEWVTSYKLPYSDGGVHFQYYMETEQNTEKVSITNGT